LVDLLGRAKDMLRGWGPAPAPLEQAYAVDCPSGHRLKGRRTEGYQVVGCPQCGENVFILPRSPLPEPATPVDRPKPPAPAATFDDWATDHPAGRTEADAPGPSVADPVEEDAEIEWDEPTPPVAPAPEPAAPDEPAPKPKPPRQAVAVPKPPEKRPVPAARPRTITVVARERESWRIWGRRRRNPLIFGGVILLVFATLALRLRRDRLSDLPRIAEIGRIEGLAALDAGEFDKAKDLLTKAARAVDALGGEYESAEAIRRGAREAALFTDLVPETLEQIVEEARSGDPETWPKRFDALYKGRSIVVDARIVAAPDADRGIPAYDLDYRIYAGKGPTPPARGRLDLRGFKLFELAGSKAGDSIRIGARLASVTLDPARGDWLVALEPDSGSFITHDRALAALGLGPADHEPGEVRP